MDNQVIGVMMKRLRIGAVIVAGMAVLGGAQGAQANGLVAEANLARWHGDWGGELGAGYAFEAAGFTLRPMAGVMLQDDGDGTGTKLYGKIEASYTLPASVELGLGARLSGDRTRSYALVSLPLAPKIRVKGNVGDGYFALGARLDF